MKEKYYNIENRVIHYYEVENNKSKLILLHAQGVTGKNFDNVIKKLAKHYHLYILDIYGHGKSTHDKSLYNIKTIGEDIKMFISDCINDHFSLLGHSSGGLIACYVASKNDYCNYLILEDTPLFSSCGDNRFNTFAYKDMQSVCYAFLNQSDETDFVYYYFKNQYCWNFFPEESREKIKTKLCENAKKYREKYPDRTLKVMFWPKKFLEAFNGLNEYDPNFGLAFYNDSFNNVNYEELLINIKCKTLFMKANTTIGLDGLIQGALTNEDLDKVKHLIKDIKIEFFDCGHGIHIEKAKQFIQSLKEIK